MSGSYGNNPWYAPAGTWSRGSGGDVYQVPTHCPYCGEREKNPISRYEGNWFRLKCRACGQAYKVRGRG